MSAFYGDKNVGNFFSLIMTSARNENPDRVMQVRTRGIV
jgi:hypothetical protein